MVTREVASIQKPSAVMTSIASGKIEGLVSELADKHHFNLKRPGYVLWLQAPEVIKQDTDGNELRSQSLSYLAIWVNSEGYVLGLSKPHGTGFRVYYSQDWAPRRAFNENGCPNRDLSSANDQMYLLLRQYRDSILSLVIDLGCD